MGTRKVLVLAPHTDDAELGMGGTIAKLRNADAEVYVVAFSLCGNPLLLNEFRNAAAVLDVDCLAMEYQVREFQRDRQKILDEILKIGKKFNPDVVYVPCRQDVHQDHQTITNEAIRAFKHISIYGYELPWNNLVFPNTHYEALHPEHMNKKIEAIREYETQAKRKYTTEEFTRSLAHVRGVQVGYKYAEAFEVIRSVNG